MHKALGSAWPSERKHYPARGRKIDDYREVIDGWLRADLTAPRKQRHTAKRIFDRLREEQQADVSYSRVRAYVSVRRGEILAESGRAPVEVFVPQSHRPGEEAEVDFGDVVIELRGPSRARCSRCGCRSPAARFTGCSSQPGRKRSWRAMCTPFAIKRLQFSQSKSVG